MLEDGTSSGEADGGEQAGTPVVAAASHRRWQHPWYPLVPSGAGPPQHAAALGGAGVLGSCTSPRCWVSRFPISLQL